jgi:hypothetical protein
MNESRIVYLLIRNASIINGAGVPPFIADIGITATRRVATEGGRRLETATIIEDMGDLRTLGALRTIDGTGMTVVPLQEGALAEGQIVDLPEWRARGAATLAVGQPARLVVLKPAAEPGQYRVELVLR